MKCCDSIIYLLGYSSIQKNISKWTWALIISLMIIFEFLTFIPKFTFLALIINWNSVQALKILVPVLSYVHYFSLFVFDLLFSMHFISILYRVHFQKKLRVRKQTQLFVMKCVLHFIYRYFLDSALFAYPVVTHRLCLACWHSSHLGSSYRRCGSLK